MRPSKPRRCRPAAMLAAPIAAIVSTLLFAAVACESVPAATELNRANDAYAAGRFDEALDLAQSAQRRGDGSVRARSAYVGGLSAYRLGRIDEAERRLAVAANSDEPETAGRARAMLGTIASYRGRHREAADHFRRAAEELSGDEAARAAYEAGLALRAAGDPAGARSQLLIAAGGSSGAVHGDAQRELARTGFTVQAGAFRERVNAERLAAELQRRTGQARVWPVRVVPGRGRDGAAIHLVQIGEFNTRQAAEQAQRELGRLEYRVVVIGG